MTDRGPKIANLMLNGIVDKHGPVEGESLHRVRDVPPRYEPLVRVELLQGVRSLAYDGPRIHARDPHRVDAVITRVERSSEEPIPMTSSPSATTTADAPKPDARRQARIPRPRGHARGTGPVLDALFFEGERRIPYLQQYFVLMLLSAAIAAFGLVNDSAAVVIGAMLVAPLMTPILAVAAATVQGWGRRAGDSLAIVAGGALVASASASRSTFLPSLHTGLPLPDELLARTGPNMVDLVIASPRGPQPVS